MPRKGTRKVRTGCVTCKIRKVKCDENKPACNRCTTTGRYCDGYQVDILKSTPPLPRQQETVTLYQPHRSFHGISKVSEGRALQYFNEIAGPLLSGSTDPYFWTHVVLQFSNFEPAVRHAVIAISNLYEQGHGGDGVGTAAEYDNQRLSLLHYNAAIREMRTFDYREKQAVVLLVCILFICIEVIRDNKKGALIHCTHGLQILNTVHPSRMSLWAREHIWPIFRRLSGFAHFDGENADADIPHMKIMEEPFPLFFSTFAEAQMRLEVIYNRMRDLMRLRRTAERMQHQPPQFSSELFQGNLIMPKLLAEQTAVNKLLDTWLSHFTEFETRMLSPDSSGSLLSDTDNKSCVQRCLLLVRHECCRIWLNNAFESGEPGHDRYLVNFRNILHHLLRLEAKLKKRSLSNPMRSPYFSFETGFGTELFFLVSTCHDFPTRLEFLRLIPVLGLPRENVWSRDVLLAGARKIIEMEHTTTLDCFGQPLNPPSPARSQGEIRILDLWLEPQVSHEIWDTGKHQHEMMTVDKTHVSERGDRGCSHPQIMTAWAENFSIAIRRLPSCACKIDYRESKH